MGKKLLLFSIALLSIPIGVIIVLLRIFYYQIRIAAPYSEPNISQVFLNNYSFLLGIVLIVGLVLILLIGTWFLRSILKPIGLLSKAAKEIEKGNLDLSLEYQKEDEFGHVFEQFDQMRIYLKDLLWQQVEDERERINMTANIAHDIKTPITSIRGYAQGLLDNVATSKEKEQHYLNTIIEKADSVNNMVEQLSLLSKMAIKTMHFERQRVSVVNFIRDCMDDAFINHHEIDLTMQLNIEDQMKINIDPIETRRVIDNIVRNSVKYKKGDRIKINVAVNENEESVIFCFADDGMGVPDKDINELFKRFYRGDQARQNPSMGSGLGLSICKEIVEEQGGWIWARPNKWGGLSVYFSFPKQA